METNQILIAATELVRAQPKNISIALLQRHLRLGYSQAQQLMAELERIGVVVHAGDVALGQRYVLYDLAA